MSSRIIASVAAYGDTIFLDQVIGSLVPFVDEVILSDTAFKATIDMGLPAKSTGESRIIIDKWAGHEKVFMAPDPPKPPVGMELSIPAFNLAKERGADWYFTVGSDEIWPPESLKFLKEYLKICDKRGILGVNVWMYMFAPDLFHFKDFRNPRVGRVTPDSVLSSGDALAWPQRGVYQYAGDCERFAPAGTPKKVLDVNIDFPRNFKVFHYSCVGKSRVESKVNYYKKLNGTSCDRYCENYMKQNWKAFPEMGFKEFHGKHPDIMLTHPLMGERLY
jgi:hypothetical protein